MVLPMGSKCSNVGDIPMQLQDSALSKKSCPSKRGHWEMCNRLCIQMLTNASICYKLFQLLVSCLALLLQHYPLYFIHGSLSLWPFILKAKEFYSLFNLRVPTVSWQCQLGPHWAEPCKSTWQGNNVAWNMGILRTVSNYLPEESCGVKNLLRA